MHFCSFEYQLKAQPVPEIQRVPLEQLLLRIKMLPSFSDSSLKKVLGKVKPVYLKERKNSFQNSPIIGALNFS